MDNRQMAVEILRYPILILSICLALLILKRCAGYEISKLGPHGAEFSQQAQVTERAVSEIEARLNEIEVRVADLDSQLNPESSGTAFKQQEEIQKVEVAAGSAAQTVSDATAQIAVLRRSMSDERVSGYIWIGNYKQEWDSVVLAALDTGQPIMIKPTQILPGTQYRVLANMVLRDGLPSNDAQYFRARSNLGVIPRGTVITIQESPAGIDREFAVQYWVKVGVAQAAKSQ